MTSIGPISNSPPTPPLKPEVHILPPVDQIQLVKERPKPGLMA